MSSSTPTPETNSGPHSSSEETVTVSDVDLGRLLRGIAPLSLILLAALASMVSLCRSDSDEASEGDWRKAAEFVRAAKVDGELIVFAPEWIDPIGRQYLGDQMSIEMVGRMDSARFSGIWEVSSHGESASETSGLSSDKHKSFGNLHVRHYPQKPVKLSYDFSKEWRKAKVTGQGRPRYGLQEVGFAPHHCILVIPQPNKSVSLTFGEAVLGKKIVGYVGLSDVFSRRKIRDPGQLEVLIDGKLVGATTAGVEDGWVPFSVSTSAGQASVEFRLSAVGAGAQNRRVCFAAEARL